MLHGYSESSVVHNIVISVIELIHINNFARRRRRRWSQVRLPGGKRKKSSVAAHHGPHSGSLM